MKVQVTNCTDVTMSCVRQVCRALTFDSLLELRHFQMIQQVEYNAVNPVKLNTKDKTMPPKVDAVEEVSQEERVTVVARHALSCTVTESLQNSRYIVTIGELMLRKTPRISTRKTSFRASRLLAIRAMYVYGQNTAQCRSTYMIQVLRN